MLATSNRNRNLSRIAKLTSASYEEICKRYYFLSDWAVEAALETINLGCDLDITTDDTVEASLMLARIERAAGGRHAGEHAHDQDPHVNQATAFYDFGASEIVMCVGMIFVCLIATYSLGES